MFSLTKYRRMSIIVMIVMAVAWLLSLAALWNSTLSGTLKHSGWLMIFVFVIFISGIVLFYIAFTNTNTTHIENLRKEAFDLGKSEVLKEFERKNQEEVEKKSASEDLNNRVCNILAGIQSSRTESTLCNKLLSNLARETGIVQGIIYLQDKDKKDYNPVGQYAIAGRKPEPVKYGENLPGQVAANKSMMVVYDIPENYFEISSGLGKTKNGYLVIMPLLIENECIAVMELALFTKPDETVLRVINMALKEIAPKLNKFINA